MTNPATKRQGSKLIIAVPSKGRIKAQSLEVFAKAGLTVPDNADSRTYRASIVELPMADVSFLSSSEIAREIGAGNANIGITGLDLLHEHVPAWETRVEVWRPI